MWEYPIAKYVTGSGGTTSARDSSVPLCAVAEHVSLSSPGRLWTLVFSPSTEGPTRS